MASFHKEYDLTLEMRPDYLYALVRSDSINQQLVVHYLHEVITTCKKLHRTRLLLERDIPSALNESEVYFSGTDFAHTGLSEMKVAVVDRRPENVDNLELTILVQNNRGANIKLFADIAAAEAWLKKPLPHLSDSGQVTSELREAAE